MNLKEIFIIVLIGLVIMAGVKLINVEVVPPVFQPFEEEAAGSISSTQETVSGGDLNESIASQSNASDVESSFLSVFNEDGELVFEQYVEEVCGNSICAETEDCSTCAQDCGCNSTQTCSAYGVCVENEFCGDGIVSDSEENCCIDAGCAQGQVCNEDLNICLRVAVPAPSAITIATSSFLARNNNSYTVGEITDYVYDDVPVKKIRMQCNEDLITGFGDEVYPCDVYLLIDSNGNLVDTLEPN